MFDAMFNVHGGDAVTLTKMYTTLILRAHHVAPKSLYMHQWLSDSLLHYIDGMLTKALSSPWPGAILPLI